MCGGAGGDEFGRPGWSQPVTVEPGAAVPREGHRMTTKTGSKQYALDEQFTVPLQKSPAKGGWTYVVWPESAAFFKTRGLVKVRGTIDGHPFEGSFMALGDGTHKLAVKADIRRALGKDVGDEVTVHLRERLG